MRFKNKQGFRNGELQWSSWFQGPQSKAREPAESASPRTILGMQITDYI